MTSVPGRLRTPQPVLKSPQASTADRQRDSEERGFPLKLAGQLDNHGSPLLHASVLQLPPVPLTQPLLPQTQHDRLQSMEQQQLLQRHEGLTDVPHIPPQMQQLQEHVDFLLLAALETFRGRGPRSRLKESTSLPRCAINAAETLARLEAAQDDLASLEAQAGRRRVDARDRFAEATRALRHNVNQLRVVLQTRDLRFKVEQLTDAAFLAEADALLADDECATAKQRVQDARTALEDARAFLSVLEATQPRAFSQAELESH